MDLIRSRMPTADACPGQVKVTNLWELEPRSAHPDVLEDEAELGLACDSSASQ